ncbi:MAG TPA: nuclear transport factor 2 family protein [Acidothermaceae bacterium]
MEPPMASSALCNFEAIADRFEIEALRGEFTDALMMRDYDRLAGLFTQDGVVRMPHLNAEVVSRTAIRAAVERLQGLCEYFVQTTHAGTIQLAGDVASGRTYMSELGRLGDGSSHLNYAVYHDRYQRTPDGWKFTERVYEIKYVDTTPLAGSAPPTAGVADQPADPEKVFDEESGSRWLHSVCQARGLAVTKMKGTPDDVAK